jgi:hypothetical protein
MSELCRQSIRASPRAVALGAPSLIEAQKSATKSGDLRIVWVGVLQSVRDLKVLYEYL